MTTHSNPVTQTASALVEHQFSLNSHDLYERFLVIPNWGILLRSTACLTALFRTSPVDMNVTGTDIHAPGAIDLKHL